METKGQRPYSEKEKATLKPKQDHCITARIEA